MECSCGAPISTQTEKLSTEQALVMFPGQRRNIPKDQSEIFIRYGNCDSCGRLAFFSKALKEKSQGGVLRFFKKNS